MPTEMGSEAVEIVTMAMDKYQANKNYEVRDDQEIMIAFFYIFIWHNAMQCNFTLISLFSLGCCSIN